MAETYEEVFARGWRDNRVILTHESRSIAIPVSSLARKHISHEGVNNLKGIAVPLGVRDDRLSSTATRHATYLS